jgi:hypothetical protein
LIVADEDDDDDPDAPDTWLGAPAPRPPVTNGGARTAAAGGDMGRVASLAGRVREGMRRRPVTGAGSPRFVTPPAPMPMTPATPAAATAPDPPATTPDDRASIVRLLRSV